MPDVAFMSPLFGDPGWATQIVAMCVLFKKKKNIEKAVLMSLSDRHVIFRFIMRLEFEKTT